MPILVAALFLCTYCVLSTFSLDLILPTPPTGGDMGSHYYTSWVLHTIALPNWSIRTWHPGNFGGEFQLLHYFPAPFILTEVLSLLLPHPVAFKFMSIMHLLVLPFALAWAIRQLGFCSRACALSATGSLIFLFNESFTMWGGNSLSTLAGQFAHGHALVFLFLWLGMLAREIRKDIFPLGSGLLGMFVALSHPYVALVLPVHMLGFLATSTKNQRRATLKHLALSGILTFLFSAWWILPMVENAPWNIAFYLFWNRDLLLPDTLPVQWLLVLCPACFSFGCALILKKKLLNSSIIFAQVLIPALFYFVCFFLFPYLGVIDIRALPQLQLYLLLLAALLLSQALNSLKKYAPIATLFFCIYFFSIAQSQIDKFPVWFKWNMSGWGTKPYALEFEKVTQLLKEDNQPQRVVYEHGDLNNLTGTVRAFEMLPYFSERATMEGLYLQSSLLSPAAFLLQSEISETPSCPFIQYACTAPSLTKAKAHLNLLGVSTLILFTEDLVNHARRLSWLEEKFQVSPWTVFKVKDAPALSEVITTPITTLEPRMDYKKIFYEWLTEYKPDLPLLVRNNKQQIEKSSSVESKDCKTSAHAQFNKIELDTTCPGKPHLLKFAYSPLLQSTTGETLSLAAPGMIALTPNTPHTEIIPVASPVWILGKYLSIIGFIFALVAKIFLKKRD